MPSSKKASHVISSTLCVLLLAARATAAPEQETVEPPPLDWSYLTDGGAVPFIYLPTAVTLAAKLGVPPAPPIAFSAEEGGEEWRPSTVPIYQVGVLAGALTLSVAAFDRKARWFHTKGIMQSFATTAAITELAKITFGRHRPHYDPVTSTDSDDRKSFFSAHASLTSATALYLGMYVRQHGAGGGELKWWELPVYSSLAAISVYVPYTRVVDHKHHVSDVITGGLVGSAVAVGFYRFQERRYRTALGGKRSNSGGKSLGVSPWTQGAGASVAGTF